VCVSDFLCLCEWVSDGERNPSLGVLICLSVCVCVCVCMCVCVYVCTCPAVLESRPRATCCLAANLALAHSFLHSDLPLLRSRVCILLLCGCVLLLVLCVGVRVCVFVCVWVGMLVVIFWKVHA
jgi:hypothetical protein